MVKVDGLLKHFRGRVLLDGIALRIAPGELLILTGPSGCGKTTLLRLIAGFDIPERGEVFIKGNLATCGNRICLRPYDRDVGMVFQDFALWPHLTVEENILYGLRYRALGKLQVAQYLHESLDTFDLRNIAKAYPSKLSGGERQRVALARALARRPGILLLDEPVSNLDNAHRKAALGQIDNIRQTTKAAVLLVTHSMPEIEMKDTRHLVLEHGKLIDG